MADNKELEELRRQVADLEDLLAMQGGVLRKRIERLERRLGMPPEDAPAQAPPAAPAPPLPDAPPAVEFPAIYPGAKSKEKSAEASSSGPTSNPKPPAAAPLASGSGGRDWERIIGTKVLPIVGALLFLVAMGFAVALAIENQALSLQMQFGLELTVCAVFAGIGLWRLKDGSSFGQTLLAAGLGGAFLSVAGAHVFKAVIPYEAMIPAFAALGIGAAITSTVWPAPAVHLIGFAGAMVAAGMPIRNGDPTATVLLGAMAHAAGFGPLFRRPRPALAHLHMAMAGFFGVWCLSRIAPDAAPWKALAVLGLPVLAWALYCQLNLGEPKRRTWMAAWLAPPFFFAALAGVFSDPATESLWRWTPWVFGMGAAAIAAALLGRGERRRWAASGAALMLTLTGPLSAPMPQAHWMWLSLAVLGAAAAWILRGRPAAALAGLIGASSAAYSAAASLNPAHATAASAAASALTVIIAAAGLLPNWKRPERVLISGAIVAFLPASLALSLAQNPEGFDPRLAFWMAPAFAMLMLAAAALMAWRVAAWAGLGFTLLASLALYALRGNPGVWQAGAVMGLAIAATFVARSLKDAKPVSAAIVGGIALVMAPLSLPDEPRVALQLGFAAALATAAFVKVLPSSLRLTFSVLSGALTLSAFFQLAFSADGLFGAPWTAAGLAMTAFAAAAIGRTTRKGEWALMACSPFAGLLFAALLGDIFGPAISSEAVAYWSFAAASVSLLTFSAWRRWRISAALGACLALVASLIFIGQRMNEETATLAQGGSMVVLGLAAMAGLVRGWGSKGWCWAAPVAVIWPGWSMLVAEGMRRAFAIPEAASFSAAWSSLALAALAAGFAFSQRALRGVGLALFGCVSVKVLLVDLSELEAWIRVLAVGVVALLLLAGGWLYVRRELGRRKAEPTVERPPD